MRWNRRKGVELFFLSFGFSACTTRIGQCASGLYVGHTLPHPLGSGTKFLACGEKRSPTSSVCRSYSSTSVRISHLASAQLVIQSLFISRSSSVPLDVIAILLSLFHTNFTYGTILMFLMDYDLL